MALRNYLIPILIATCGVWLFSNKDEQNEFSPVVSNEEESDRSKVLLSASKIPISNSVHEDAKELTAKIAIAVDKKENLIDSLPNSESSKNIEPTTQNLVLLKDLAIVEVEWHESRDEFYKSVLASAEEYEILQNLRNKREQFLSFFLQSDSTFVPNLQADDWHQIEKNAEWFDYEVQSLLGESRYAKLLDRRDEFNESIKDESKAISIGSDW